MVVSVVRTLMTRGQGVGAVRMVVERRERRQGRVQRRQAKQLKSCDAVGLNLAFDLTPGLAAVDFRGTHAD